MTECLVKPTASRTVRRLALPALVLAVTLPVVWLAGTLAEARAEDALRLRTQRSASLFDGLLAREVARHRAAPAVLSTDPAITGLLARRQRDPALDARLAAVARDMQAAAVYAISADGITRASSNAATAGSFVGNDYRFRRYFHDAMAKGSAAEFALGTISRRPGLYLATRVGLAEAPLGVVVVKVDLQTLEADWAQSGARVAVSDPGGRILVTSVPNWRFRTLAEAGLAPPATDIRLVGMPATAVDGWRLNLAVPAARELSVARRQAQLLTASALAVLGMLVFLLLRRIRARRAEADRQARAKIELEARVQERTAELSNANARLRNEMEDRRRAEEEASLLHRELEQANRLATLGQIAAGVTHEISQPVAAIRASAHNAGICLQRGDAAGAAEDLSFISKLTEQIGAITGELRSFSRKGSRSPTVTPVDDAIDGALALLASRLRRVDADVTRMPTSTGLMVRADRVRLEQVLVNLIQNALDAQTRRGMLELRPDLRIDARREDGGIAIRVTDRGEGVSAEMAAQLFTPFRTSRDDGLGLGLVISRDIATDLGGELDHEPHPSGRPGATFRLWLPSA
jgi:two-component system C4-dicarboxylate transport sensor histidine kinase DctB